MKALVLGAAGFLGSHLEHRLKSDGHFVVSAGRSRPKYRASVADEFHIADLRDIRNVNVLMARHEFDHVYQLAGEVGGLGYIAVGEHDARIMTDSLKINFAVLDAARSINPGKILFASSQCVYPDRFEIDPFGAERFGGLTIPSAHKETDAHFDTFAFGQEKLFSEKLYDAYARNHGLNIAIARIGNTYGPFCTYDGQRAKAPAAICRKVAAAPYAGVVDLFGDGQQSRSFTYVGDVIDGLIRLMATDYHGPVNIAHSETATIQELFETVCRVANKVMAWRPSEGPVGVQARGSDNTLCRQVLGWEPTTSLWNGLAVTYPWVRDQVRDRVDARTPV